MSNKTSNHRGETLTEKVSRLQQEYIACDDFPTARHEIKAELDLAREELRKQPVSQLEARITKLSREYADCDDFPTARGNIKRDLDAARESLRSLQEQMLAPSTAPSL